MSSEQDAFFKANMYENFGDIGMNIKRMVDDFQQVAKSNQNIQTIGSFDAKLSFPDTLVQLAKVLIHGYGLPLNHWNTLISCRRYGQICRKLPGV